jgi:peptide/nickel transport system permease protein
VTGEPYRLSGWMTGRRHLFGVQGDGKLFLLGSDGYGRDEFSRLLFGGRVSLFAGLLAALISVLLGTVMGGLAGYYGRWIDDGIMRFSEIFLSVPWLYLLLAVRAALPLHVPGSTILVLLSLMLGVIGWARPARLVRGVVLSAKQRDYVEAARGFGASDFYILRVHVLPYAAGVAAAQVALYVPQYILAEVTLSFFGLGVSEPAASWGNMLAGLQQSFVLQSCWWLFAPAAALTAILVAYHSLFARYTSFARIE